MTEIGWTVKMTGIEADRASELQVRCTNGFHRWLRAGALLALALPALAAPHATASNGHRPVLVRDTLAGVDTAVASDKQAQADTTAEPSIATNPENAKNIVVGYQMGRFATGGDAGNGYAASFDGGRSWTHGTLPGLTRHDGGRFDHASDAVVTFGPHDTVHYSSLAFTDPAPPVPGSPVSTRTDAVLSSTSRDGGRTWGRPVIVFEDPSGFSDKNWEVVDTGSGSGHHPGRLYVAWDRGAGPVPVAGPPADVLVSYSDDAGTTFSAPSLVYAGQGIGALPVVLPDGSLAVVFTTDIAPVPALHPGAAGEESEATSGFSRIVIARSPAAGSVEAGAPLVFAPPTTVGTYSGHEPRQQRASVGLPAVTTDPRTGRLYVGWDDSRFRAETASPVQDPVLTWSDDAGVTWSPLKAIRTGPGKDFVNRYDSMLGVGPDGTLSLAYRQRREAASMDDASRYVDTYYVRSKDAGATFSAPLRVNRSVRTELGFSAVSGLGLGPATARSFLGDYDQLAVARDGTVYVVRCESYSTRRGEQPDLPATTHHQRTWVGVVR